MEITPDTIITGIELILGGIGLATVLLQMVAPLTKSNVDNKILKYLLIILEKVSLNMDTKELKIKIK